MNEKEKINNFLNNLDLPEECDFCIYFSGNCGKGYRDVYVGECMNELSSKFSKRVKEIDTCDEGNFE